METELTSRITNFNQHRDPNFLALKYKAMYEDKYRFFRATAHLFFEDIPADSFIHKAPPVWVCGDLHLENFGSYKSDNRIAYFNINDFDECFLASPLLDVVRLLTSLHVATSSLKIPLKVVYKLNDIFIDTYFQKLEEGYIRVLEKETTSGVVKNFLEEVQDRKREVFIKKKTFVDKGKIKLLIDNVHTIKIKKEEKKLIINSIKKWASKMKQPSFFEVKDIAQRISGTASLGLKRYIVLIEGKGTPSANYLLDIKETRPSCLNGFVKIKQPKWNSEAERIIEIQKRFISDPPALLQSITIQDKNFVVKELQPSADRIEYKLFSKDVKKLSSILNHMACIYAWSNLRTGGRQESAIADELILFAKNKQTLKKELKEYALSYSEKIDLYYSEYRKAFKKGAFNKKIK
jgi:uncharacterized protein (DUF2252 family)